MTWKPIQKPTATLGKMGFAPVSGRKVAGCSALWNHPDGRTAFIDFGLVGRTGQSAGHAGWAYLVQFNEAPAT